MYKNMVTIFDYNITDYELKLLYVDCKSREEYLQKTSSKKVLQDLYVLFRMREDVTRAGTIREKIMGKVA